MPNSHRPQFCLSGVAVWTSFTFTHETQNRRFCERLELVDDKIISNKTLENVH